MKRHAAALLAVLAFAGCADGDKPERIVGTPTTTTIDPVVAELRAAQAELDRLEREIYIGNVDRAALREEVKRLYVQRASRSTTQARPVRRVTVAGSDVWAALRQCESGGDYTKNTGNDYYGAYQFSASTWRSMGTGYAYAHEAPPAVQDDAARRLQARSGWRPWPACSRRLGLR